MNVCLFCCSLDLMHVLIVVIMGRLSEFSALVRVLCARLCGCIALWRLL